MPESDRERDDARQRWALILGASTGTGAAIARAVARDPGLNVFGIHRGHYVDEARVLEEELRAMGRDVILHVADAGHRQGVEACAAALEERIGKRRVALC